MICLNRLMVELGIEIVETYIDRTHISICLAIYFNLCGIFRKNREIVQRHIVEIYYGA